MTQPSESPHRGAPPGNTNALKHGFYSHTFQDPEQLDLSGLDSTSLDSEIQLLRVFIRRVAQQAEQVAGLPESMSLLAVLSRATLSLAALIRTQHAFVAAASRREFQGVLAQTTAEISRADAFLTRQFSKEFPDSDTEREVFGHPSAIRQVRPGSPPAVRPARPRPVAPPPESKPIAGSPAPPPPAIITSTPEEFRKNALSTLALLDKLRAL